MKNVALFRNGDSDRPHLVTRWVVIIAATNVAVLGVAGSLQCEEPVGRPPKLLEEIAGSIVAGARAEEQWQLGQRLEKEMSLKDRSKSIRKKDFVGRKVVLLGGCVPPGDSPDLKTFGGLHVRVVCKEKIDLRPQAVTWASLVVGKVIAVHPEKCLVVVEISDKSGYIVLMTS